MTKLYKKKKERTDNPNPVDVYVGERIRKIRLLRGLTQQDLAKHKGKVY